MIRKSPGLVVALLCTLVLAGPVLAEGSWQSFISNALPGFDSRTWTDRNVDAANTTIRFDTCRDSVANGNNDWAQIALMKMNFAWPAENRGEIVLFCFVSATGNWGRQPAADYQFELKARSGPNENWNNLDVGFVRVSY